MGALGRDAWPTASNGARRRADTDRGGDTLAGLARRRRRVDRDAASDSAQPRAAGARGPVAACFEASTFHSHPAQDHLCRFPPRVISVVRARICFRGVPR